MKSRKKQFAALFLTLALALGLGLWMAFGTGTAGKTKTLSLGGYHSAFIQPDGSLWMWGENWSGQLGNGGGGNAKDSNGHPIQTVPVKIMDNVAEVSLGNTKVIPPGVQHSAAIKTDGSLWMWGKNYSGQLGNGGGSNAKDSDGHPIQTVPVRVDFPV